MLKILLNLVFPKYCVGCGLNGEYICCRCIGRLVFLKAQTCPNCRRKNHGGEFCHWKCARGYHFKKLIVCMGYGKNSILKKLVVLFKYKFSRELCELLGRVMKWQFAKFSHGILGRQGALVVPVPLGKKRHRYRGFNQAGLLAEELSKNFNNLKFADCLEKQESEDNQAKLGREDRIMNVKGTINMKVRQISGNGETPVSGRQVLLVDDVATTCSTLNECSRVLMEAGANEVVCIVLARGWLYIAGVDRSITGSFSAVKNAKIAT